MKQAPNDASRWFVVEQGGVVRTFQNDPDATAATDFIDISSRVHMEGEAGLLGMAFHPSFATNGLVYLNFTGLGDDEALDAGVDTAFGRNLKRLAEVKAEYDPTNFFRVNNNIEPAS